MRMFLISRFGRTIAAAAAPALVLPLSDDPEGEEDQGQRHHRQRGGGLPIGIE